jgi:signal transduction histidine kinase
MSRAIEDHILQRERLTADHVLHRERSEHVALLSQERQATDHDLSHERARSDKSLALRDEFMGIVSHDLLNLLNAMVGISRSSRRTLRWRTMSSALWHTRGRAAIRYSDA